ncbi:MAG: ParA family protein [Chitinophagales bacterium]
MLLTTSFNLGAEIELINHPNRERILKQVLQEVKDDYDYIFIDCSPSSVFDHRKCAFRRQLLMLVPVTCEYFALEGLGKLLNTIKIVQNRLNDHLQIEGILLTMYDARLRLSNQIVTEVKRHFSEMVFDVIIHRNTKLGEAPSFGKPVIMYDADCTGALNYLNLAREILQKNGSINSDHVNELLNITSENAYTVPSNPVYLNMSNKKPDLGKGIRALLEGMESDPSVDISKER